MSTRTPIAIPYPAVSIPAPWRLYHGGCAYRGELTTHDPDSWAYLGDYVYFSTERHYAARYLNSRRKRPESARWRRTATLYVIDARRLPAGSRIMARRGKRRTGSFDGYLCDLVDLNGELHFLADATSTPQDRAWALYRLSIRASRFHFLGPQAVYGWFGGTDTPTPAQVSRAREEIRCKWLDVMTRPLSPRDVPRARVAVDLALAAKVQEGKWGKGVAVDGTIVLVPGPVRALFKGAHAIDRSDQRRAIARRGADHEFE